MDTQSCNNYYEIITRCWGVRKLMQKNKHYCMIIAMHCDPWNVFILKPALLYCLFHSVCYVKPFLCSIYWVILSVIS